MSTESVAAAPAWPVLSLHERRVLGVLVEKAKTTPDIYPLSMNALITGCNQKSNRDPVLNLSDFQIEEALGKLQNRELVAKITGSGRVEKFRHLLYEAWHVEKVEIAILAELVLRGPQTEGELRGRASRMEPIADVDALRAVLKPLAERGLVVYLSAEGKRGTMLSHGFHAPEDLERLRATHGKESSGAPAETAITGPDSPAAETLTTLAAQMTQVLADIAALRADLAGLQTQVAQLSDQLQALERSRNTVGGRP